MNFIQKQIAAGRSPKEACILLLRRVGFYSFNRWARKQGLLIDFVLAVHRLAAQKEKA